MATAREFLVVQSGAVECFSVEGRRLHVLVVLRGIGRFDREASPVAQIYGGTGEKGAADVVVELASVRVEAHGAPDVPGRHGARVIVAREAGAPGRVIAGEQVPDALGGLVGTAGVEVQVQGEDVRLVVLGMYSFVEELVEPRDELLVAAELVYEALNVMRDVGRVLVTVSLVERRVEDAVLVVRVVMGRVEVLQVRAIGVSRADRTGLIVPQVPPVPGAFEVLLVILFVY